MKKGDDAWVNSHREDLVKLITAENHNVIKVKGRLVYVKAFLDELVDKTNGEPFHIHNWFAYQSVVDSADMLVIDLASIVRGMLKRGGFFRQLRHYGAGLRRATKKTEPLPDIMLGDFDHIPYVDENGVEHPITPRTPEQRKQDSLMLRIASQARTIDAVNEVHARLFPDALPQGAAQSCVRPEDVDELAERFRKEMEPLIKDRDQLRAHRFEERNPTAVRQTFTDMEGHFKAVERLLNDLRAIVERGAYIHKPFTSRVKSTAEDLVDLVLIGSTQRVITVFGLLPVGERFMGKRWAEARQEYWSAKKENSPPKDPDPGLEE